MDVDGGHAEPVIGRAFARPVGFAHPTSLRRVALTDLPAVSSPPAKNISLRREVEAVLLGCPSRLGKRGVCAIVTKREAGCDGRTRRTRRVRVLADGEVVAS